MDTPEHSSTSRPVRHLAAGDDPSLRLGPAGGARRRGRPPFVYTVGLSGFGTPSSCCSAPRRPPRPRLNDLGELVRAAAAGRRRGSRSARACTCSRSRTRRLAARGQRALPAARRSAGPGAAGHPGDELVPSRRRPAVRVWDPDRRELPVTTPRPGRRADGSTCIATPAATPALIERVEPNWAMDTTRSRLVRGPDTPGPSCPNSSRQARGSSAVSSRRAPGTLSTATTASLPAGESDQLVDRVVVVQPQVAVGHHGPAAVPAASAHDVHPGRAERVRRAHHGADVVVVPEVLDGDVERVGAGGQVGGHRVASPVAVGVDHVAGVAVLEQLGVVARVGGPARRPARPRADTDLARHRHSLGSVGSGDAHGVVGSSATGGMPR